jgi:hypothetical protein
MLAGLVFFLPCFGLHVHALDFRHQALEKPVQVETKLWFSSKAIMEEEKEEGISKKGP